MQERCSHISEFQDPLVSTKLGIGVAKELYLKQLKLLLG
jgi:hypothetical protein